MAPHQDNGGTTETAVPPLRLVYMDPDELQANDRNWRRHPPAQEAALRDILAEVGWAGALLLNEASGKLIDGHLRKKVARGGKVPVLVGSWSPEQERKILVTLDPVAGMAEADRDALDALLRDVQTGSQAVADLLTGLAEENDLVPGGGGLLPAGAGGQQVEEEEAGDEPEDGLDLVFKAPFPWFGGKARVARMVWKRFGDVAGYIEPFFGSGAVLLNRPLPEGSREPAGVETVNDLDGFISNFWRSVRTDPDAVAHHADWPVNENCLHARHTWLLGVKDTLAPRLEGDPDWCDPKVAGWWV